MNTTTMAPRGREPIEDVIYAEDLLEEQFPGYHQQVEDDIKRMMTPGYRPIICIGGYLFPPPPMLRPSTRRIPTFDEETEEYLKEALRHVR